jgi:hypothetical protein
MISLRLLFQSAFNVVFGSSRGNRMRFESLMAVTINFCNETQCSPVDASFLPDDSAPNRRRPDSY